MAAHRQPDGQHLRIAGTELTAMTLLVSLTRDRIDDCDVRWHARRPDPSIGGERTG
jgi:hypothetical protein